MMEWLILCSDTASAAVRVLVCFLIMHRAADGKKQERTAAWILAAGIVGTAVLSGLTALPGLPGVYRLALGTAWIVFCGVRFGCLDVRMGLRRRCAGRRSAGNSEKRTAQLWGEMPVRCAVRCSLMGSCQRL